MLRPTIYRPSALMSQLRPIGAVRTSPNDTAPPEPPSSEVETPTAGPLVEAFNGSSGLFDARGGIDAGIR